MRADVCLLVGIGQRDVNLFLKSLDFFHGVERRSYSESGGIEERVVLRREV